MNLQPRNTGWIEVICGPMFSGKTEELIRRLKRAFIAREHVQVFKPSIDIRYDQTRVASHEGRTINAEVVEDTEGIRAKVHKNVKVIGIDEIQFFGPSIVELCEELANNGIRVIVAGLDQDYLGKPFEPVPNLMAGAEYVTKVLAICVLCGNPAGRSHRTVNKLEDKNRVLVGASDSYQPLCRACFYDQKKVIDQLAGQGKLHFEGKKNE